MTDLRNEATTSSGQPVEEPNFVIIDEARPPARFMRAHERLLPCRLSVGVIRRNNEAYGAGFAANSDSCTLRAMKHGYVERVHNAYRMTDKLNVLDSQRLQRRIDRIL